MTHEEIIARLNDVAKLLDEQADNPYEVRGRAAFLRATAERIANDDELEQKIAMLTLTHNMEKFVQRKLT